MPLIYIRVSQGKGRPRRYPRHSTRIYLRSNTLGIIRDHHEALFGCSNSKSCAITILTMLTVSQLYFALLALVSPSKLSIVQLAALNETSTSLRYTFPAIRASLSLWPGQFSRLMNVYAALDIKNKMKDGKTPFPRSGYEASEGMSIQFKYVDTNVSFTWQLTLLCAL